MEYLIVGSLVIYEPDLEKLDQVIDSFFCQTTRDFKIKLVVIDNSSTPLGNANVLEEKYNLEYLFHGKNVGFGAAHNIVMKKFLSKSKFFLILNPDVYFVGNILLEMTSFMNKFNSVGLVSGEIMNPDGSSQYVHRRIPSIFDLYLRRFAPSYIKKIFKSKLKQNILMDIDHSKNYVAPYVSGCFMFFRSAVLEKINGFDERFFMYMEDVDISRRALELGDNVILSSCLIYHHWARASYKSKKFLKINLKSNLYYFAKWGFFFDLKRIILNKKVRNL